VLLRESSVFGPIDLNIESRTPKTQSAATSSTKGFEDSSVQRQQQLHATKKGGKRKASTHEDEEVGRTFLVTKTSDRPQKKSKTDVEVNSEGRGEGTDSHRTLELGLLRVPLEILWEIYKLSTPMDLLTLSRANKTFRTHVLNDKSEVVEKLWMSVCCIHVISSTSFWSAICN
jgi:hypothetical protein